MIWKQLYLKMNNNTNKKINEIVATYYRVTQVMDGDASNEEERAYGGVLRAVKGKLQEHITEQIIKVAWENIGGDIARLSIDAKRHKIPIKEEYIYQIKDDNIREHISSNLSDYHFGASVDKQVYIDGNFVIGIECKAYTENAMIKRILVDFSLLKTIYPDISCYLFQLESQLGGDYSEIKEVTFGSKSTHTLMSYFPDVELQIFTFLHGERNVKRPIHKEGFSKSLDINQIKKAAMLISQKLKNYL